RATALDALDALPAPDGTDQKHQRICLHDQKLAQMMDRGTTSLAWPRERGRTSFVMIVRARAAAICGSALRLRRRPVAAARQKRLVPPGFDRGGIRIIMRGCIAHRAPGCAPRSPWP